MVIELPRVQLTDQLTATIDRRLDEVRLLETYADTRMLHFIPMAKIRELCEMVR